MDAGERKPDKFEVQYLDNDCDKAIVKHYYETVANAMLNEHILKFKAYKKNIHHNTKDETNAIVACFYDDISLATYQSEHHDLMNFTYAENDFEKIFEVNFKEIMKKSDDLDFLKKLPDIKENIKIFVASFLKIHPSFIHVRIIIL